MTSGAAHEMRIPIQEEMDEPGSDKLMPLARGASRVQCRICLEEGNEDDLIQPCNCSGTVKWVHRECLDKWRVNPGNPRAFYVCLTCNFEYELTLVRAKTEDEEQLKKRRRRFMQKVIGKFILGVCIVQIWTVSLGSVIRLGDPDQVLLKRFEQGIPKKRFLVSFFEKLIPSAFHEFTSFLICPGFEVYYLAAIVTTLTCVGFFICAGNYLARMFNYTCHRCCDNCAHTSLGGLYLDQAILLNYGCHCACCDEQPCGPCCECFGDCCYFCEKTNCSNGDCPGCDHGSCRSDDCNCNSLSNGGCDEEFALLAIVFAVVAVLAVILFFVLGLFYAVFIVLIWVQRMIHRYATIKELRQLSAEYIVEDQSRPPAQDGVSASGGYGGYTLSFASSLRLDLSAAYGYEVEMSQVLMRGASDDKERAQITTNPQVETTSGASQTDLAQELGGVARLESYHSCQSWTQQQATALKMLRPQYPRPVGRWITVGTPALMQNKGRFYYEVKIGIGVSSPQFGWATNNFQEGPTTSKGVGDDVESWGTDGISFKLWHGGAHDAHWPKKWEEGHVIGLAIDIDAGVMQFSLNGEWVDGLRNKFEAAGRKVYPAISTAGQFELLVPSNAWQHTPPSKDYKGWADSGTFVRPFEEADVATTPDASWVGVVRQPPEVAPELTIPVVPQTEVAPQLPAASNSFLRNASHATEVAPQTEVALHEAAIANQADGLPKALNIGPQAEHVPQPPHAVEPVLYETSTDPDASLTVGVHRAPEVTPQNDHGQQPLAVAPQIEIVSDLVEEDSQGGVVPHKENLVQSYKMQDLRNDLMLQKLRELRERAKAAGANQMEIDAAEDADNPRIAMVELVLKLSLPGSP